MIDKFLEKSENIFIISWNYATSFDCNYLLEKKIGYTKEEISNLEFKHHSLIENINEDFIDSIKETQNTDSINEIIKIYKIISKNGKPIWFKEIITIDPQNSPQNFSSIMIDISDIKQKEIELHDIIQKKTEQNNSKDKLISIISHDLRAPFSSLLGFSEILLNETNLSEEEKREYLQYIYDASKIQLQMVNHLLDWTRLQTGAMKFEPRRIEIKDIIENCVSVLTGVIIRKNIEIKVEGGKGVFVNADEKLISQAVTNLLSNAVKFTPSGKKIKVNIGYYKNDMVEIIVKDEGVGISETNQLKLFKVENKFTQTGTAGEKGSGLGLALVKEIIEKHSGKIWFYSELHKGSEFHFTIPKSEEIILIIEEHEELQKEYEKVLKEKYPECDISFSKSGFEAMNYFIQKIPTAVITYHNMPLMNGIQLVSSLRKKDNHNKVSVIVLIDKLSENEKNEYQKYKVENFVNFNNTPTDIAEILSKVMS
jgi:two-component system, sensor histidine kinase and response regulator